MWDAPHPTWGVTGFDRKFSVLVCEAEVNVLP